jgi:putative endonuclease
MPFPLLLHRWLSFGRRSEILAIDYLRSIGYRIATSGYRAKGGEVDIVAWDGTVLVFVEVKARRSTSPPEDSVGFQKRQRIIRAAQSYISRHRLHEAQCRFDVLALTTVQGHDPQFRLLRDAFNIYG